MKKKLGTLGLAVASIVAMQTAQQTTTENKGISNAKEIQKVNPQQQQTPIQNKVAANAINDTRYLIDPTINPYYYNYGVSPKQWGMYLQRTGRQKWTKSKKA